jgi:hypothetical protein
MPSWFQLVSGAASLISSLNQIFGDDGRLNEQLDQVLRQLQDVRETLINGIQQILEAIQTVFVEVDRAFCRSNMGLADTSLYSDIANNHNNQLAERDSFLAADTVYQFVPNTPSINNVGNLEAVSTFMYVLNIRLAVMRIIDPAYSCNSNYRGEFERYITRLEGVIAYINNAITALHRVTVVTERRGSGERRQFRVVARYLRNGVVVLPEFATDWDDIIPPAETVERRANESRARGISADRQELGVVDMENTVTSYRRAFGLSLRAALISQVLNRPMMPIDFHPDGFMVDGRILPIDRDLRATLMELLCSQDFRNRVQRAWDAFVNRGDDRLAQFAYHRLFAHDATPDEIALMRGIASKYGYAAFIAALLHCNEYEERHGRGVPSIGQPIIAALQFAE